MKVKEREHARKLRKKGKSMNQIIEETGYSKASVSFWTRDIKLTPYQKNKISLRGRSIESIERRRESRLANIANKRREIIDLAKGDFTSLTIRELKLVGAMIYWGEGRKAGNWTVSLANSDPLIIKVMMRFFREVCKVPEEKFRGHIHTFENATISKTERYWSEISGIQRKQFYKTYTKPSKGGLQKRQTLPYGTLDIYVNDTKLFLTIKGWIEKIAELAINS
ncbi:MAG: hypothetical protein WBL19_02050 [Minisyncoccia bacterium]